MKNTSATLLLLLLPLFLKAQDTAKIVIETQTTPETQPVVFSAVANTISRIKRDHITHEAKIELKAIQGSKGPYSLEINGDAQLQSVSGKSVKSWAIRQEENTRFLDVYIPDEIQSTSISVTLRSKEFTLPADHSLSHIGTGEAASFSNTLRLIYEQGASGNITESPGFLPVGPKDKDTFHTTSGGRMKLQLLRDNSIPLPVSLTNASLNGTLDEDSQSILFKLTAVANVREADSTLSLLRGAASITTRPANQTYSLALINQKTGPHYQLSFPNPGNFPIEIEFAARVQSGTGLEKNIDFQIETQGVMPITLSNLGVQLEFANDRLRNDGNEWTGFLPANGAVKLSWKPVTDSGDGKLFFSTTGTVETRVGTGLVRQIHDIDYRVLQGELKQLKLKIVGPGEVVSVTGNNLLSWKVESDQLEVTLSEAIDREGLISVTTQAMLESLPSTLSPLRLEPLDSIRHSGFIRLANRGSVRLAPSDLSGLTQLSPDKFPGNPIPARQTFIYRFPSANYQYRVSCDRIQPEVHISEITLHRLTESERTIQAAVEMDIREAPIRDFDFSIPQGYSVVSVTGAEVADYILTSETQNLTVIFSNDVSGRKLVRLVLERNIAAAAETWALPKIEFPEAKSVRGDLGLSAAPGFRLSVPSSEELTERPLSAFPGEAANLQHYFRIRAPNWTAEVTTEILERSVQADVFHLYSLSEGTAYGSLLINYFITGAPSSEFTLEIPEGLENVVAEGKDLRGQRIEEGTLTVSLHQAVLGSFTLLITFEESAADSLIPGKIIPREIQNESGYIQIVSPSQVVLEPTTASESLLQLDHLELPPEFRLLSASPSLGIWQYNTRPFDLQLSIDWLNPERTLDQVVEFVEASTFISQENQTVTDLIYYVKSRDNRPFSLVLPNGATIWDVRSNGRNVASRKTGETTQIPLLLARGTSHLAEVRMRLGNTIQGGILKLPVASVPVLKTEWNIRGDHREITRLKGKYSLASAPVLPPNGFQWVGKHALIQLSIILACVILGLILRRGNRWLKLLSAIPMIAAVVFSISTAMTAHDQIRTPAPLKISLPVLSAGEPVEVETSTIPVKQLTFSKEGAFASVAGLILLIVSLFHSQRRALMSVGVLLTGGGLLLFLNGGYLFFGFIATVIVAALILPDLFHYCRKLSKPTAAAAASLLVVAAAQAETNPEFHAFDSLHETWTITEKVKQLNGEARAVLNGQPGDQFTLLSAPGILTSFESDNLLLKKQTKKDGALNYIVVIPANSDDPFAGNTAANYQLSFSYQMDFGDIKKGFTIPTGSSAIHHIDASYDQKGWEFIFPGAARITQTDSRASILLTPAASHLVKLNPKKRDPATEPTEFYVESHQLFTPSPGVVDGIHQFRIRPAQGVVKSMKFWIPPGLTVSEVEGPVGSWQFNPEELMMVAAIEPPQSGAFAIKVETQGGLNAFPTDTQLAPLLIEDASNQTGIVGLGFRGDAQPGEVATDDLSPVNIDDFDHSIVPDESTVLHRTYRYKQKGGNLAVRLNEVSPEIRVSSKKIISLGDENLLYNVNFAIDITRAGIFQLGFTVPKALEVSSISSQALHHWSDRVNGDDRIVTLHLNGKTIGHHEFSVSMVSPPPSRDEAWQLPNFSIEEANRQSGDLIIQPATGIRLSLVDRKNVSELDPRTLGTTQKGALAFRLLQKDWTVSVEIETLAPRVTGEVLHDVTIRDAQIRTSILGSFEIENAAIRNLQVRLPINSPETIKTLRANGKAVSEITKVEGETDLWEIQLKRWLTGSLQLQLEWEQRSTIEEGLFTQNPVNFPAARQLKYYMAVRPTGRLEVDLPGDVTDWRRIDWKTLPKPLRESTNRIAPALSLKSRSTPVELQLGIKRHSLADALKLRITNGEFRTVLSPYGTRLTSADLTVEVIQRSHLTMTLPPNSELFCLFVNRETIQPVKLDANRWQFPVLPDTNGRQASIFAIYLEPGDTSSSTKLNVPMLSVPMENIVWEVLSPSTLEMTSHSGNLNLIDEEFVKSQDRKNYLQQAQKRRDEQAAQAVSLLEKANDLLQAGKQSLARQALSSVANRSGLDAASNEDARVQLETLQTQQALVGLNTRRQRMYLDRGAEEAIGAGNEQLRESATRNPVIQMGDLNFRPGDLSQLLQGNSNDELVAMRKIASRIVQQQQGEEIAAPGLDISPPYEGNRYRFSRGVQVSESAPLTLELKFKRTNRVSFFRWGAIAAMVSVFAILISFAAPPSRPRATTASDQNKNSKK